MKIISQGVNLIDSAFCFTATMIPDSEFEAWLDHWLTHVNVQPERIRDFMKEYLLTRVNETQQQLIQRGMFASKHMCFVYYIIRSNYPVL